jgi:hypothetical protein
MKNWPEYITALLQHSITPRLGRGKLSLDGRRLCSNILRVFGALKRLGSSERQEFVFPYGFGWLETCSAVNF